MAAQTDDNTEGYEFHVIMHPAEEGGYWGEVIELPGCMSQGETEEELAVNLTHAIRGVLASYASDGEVPPLPQPVKTVTLRVPISA